MKQVVVDATNLHVGGGVQVASGFIQDLLEQQRAGAYRYRWVRDVQILASTEVMANLPSHLVDGLNSPRASGRRNGHIPDLRFVVFGPKYRKMAARQTIAGFADVTSIYSSRLSTPLHLRPKKVLRSTLSWRFFRSADHLVVETTAVRERLTRYGIDRSRVTVVPNTYHPVFGQYLETHGSQRMSICRHHPHMLYVARAYPHKNHDFLGQVADEYERLTGNRVITRVTLTNDEWRHRTPEFRRSAVNVGPVTVDQLPRLYADADLVIFPSLLECSSVTPLEAMVMGRPIVASDRDFVREVCGDAAAYFDPHDPKAAAKLVRRMLNDESYREEKLACASRTIRSWPKSAERTIAYLDLIDKVLRS